MDIVLAQVATVGATSLLTTGLLLGVRHGIDWDHIAAITDIASTTTGESAAPDPAAPATPKPSFGAIELRALGLAFLYALGHAVVVFALGVAALSFAALLPDWVDPIMERIVGVTLLLLGAWVFYSLVQFARGKADFRLRSRWMLVFAGVRHAASHARSAVTGKPAEQTVHVEQYGPRTAFGVGMIHGIGAETGSQALLIAAVGGAASQGLGIGMLIAFTVGLVLSNTLIALLAATGFITSTKAKPFYIALGVLTGAFSILLGLSFVLGIGLALPDLDEIFGFIGGTAGE